MNIKRRIKRQLDEFPIDVDRDKLLAFYKPQEEEQPLKVFKRRYCKPAIAILLIAVLALGTLSSFMVYAEAKEYEEASAFFEEYGLPTEGLTRKEIKTVYRDISTGTFTYRKTVEIMNAISLEINAVELETADPEALKVLWEANAKAKHLWENKRGVRYKFDGSYLVRYEDNELIWKTDTNMELTCMNLYHNYYAFPCGVLVREHTDIYLTGVAKDRFAFVDNSGKILWKYQFDGIIDDPVAAMSSGVIHIVGHDYHRNPNDTGYIITDQMNIVIIRLDMDGNLLYENSNTVEYASVSELAVTKDGYAAKAWNGEEYSVIGLSFDGEFLDNTIFNIDDKEGKINDIIYHDGQLYISTTIVTEPTDTVPPASDETAQVVNAYSVLFELGEKYGFGGKEVIEYKQSEEYKTFCKALSEIFIKKFTASLFVLDDSGAIENIFTVEGSYGSSLAESEDGQLLWQVDRIDLVAPRDPWLNFGYNEIYYTEFEMRFREGILVEKTEIGSDYRIR